MSKRGAAGCDFKITYKGKVFRQASYGVDAYSLNRFNSHKRFSERCPT